MKKYTQFLHIALVLFFLLVTNAVYAQKIIINGTVKDNNNQPIIGVNIVEVDENGRYVTGTTTDFNGNFSFRVTSDKAKIQVSFIGYQNKVFTVGDKTRFDIVLDEETTGLGEVVVMGEKMGNDGVTSIRDRATAISRLEFEELKVAQTTTVEEMLQGRISNVDITAVSGDPGAGLNIRIRGTATLNANNEPLIVVNGIPYTTSIASDFDFASANIEQFGNLIDVSPEDIESIEVLKDAASTAIYGSKAANGVLMIQTKRGTKSKPMFEYSVKFTRAQEPDPIPMLDGAGYARLIKEEHFNNDAGEWFDDTNADGSLVSAEIDFDPTWEHYHNFSQNTNWIEEITQIGYVMDHNFSVRGGGEKSRYKMSLAYQDEKGTTIGTGLKKLNVSTSLDYDLSTKIRLRTDIMFTRYDRDASYDIDGLSWTNDVRSKAYTKMPNMSVYEMDTLGNQLDSYFTPLETIQGFGTSMFNPVAVVNLASNKTLQDNTRAAFSIRYNILPNLVYDGTITMDISDSKTSSFLPYEALGYDYNSSSTNKARESYGKNSAVTTRNQLVYSPVIGMDHELVIQGLVDTESRNDRFYATETSKSASPFLQDPAGETNLNYFSASSSNYRSLGVYLQAMYKYNDKYLITIGSRYEGNSKFSRESRFGFFPMFTAAWRISEEPFMAGLTFIDDLKLRGSWGLSGNSPRDNYLYFSTYSASTQYGYMGTAGVRPDAIELTSLKWETIEQFSPGLTFWGFNNRVNVEFDVYRKTTHNLYLRNTTIPTTTGYSNISQNEGEMLNQGWEFMIDAKIIEQKDFKFSFNFNMSHNENIVLSLPENFSLESGNMLDNGNYKIRVVPGVPIGTFYGYLYDGVYVDNNDIVVKDRNGNPVYDITGEEELIMIHGANGYEFEPGDAKYRDINFDGVIDELDIKELGDYNPSIMGGFGPRVQYKNFTLNLFFYYKLGQDIINQTRMDTEKMYNHDNQSLATNWRWRSLGDSTDVPRALYNKGYNWMGSSRFVEDGSYFRLKTASISYNFGKKICNKLKVRDIRIYGTAYNLFTWTNYSGQDPEVGIGGPTSLPRDYSRTPPSKRITIGLNIKF
ncbi:MAG: SusC/RagA family TonB-linked outer membrane protein [Prolixibacteraceae bacterium]|nr:SusC/RagA family TonB-linked outer membrane protein [Prolixibacteraceae bacterium]